METITPSRVGFREYFRVSFDNDNPASATEGHVLSVVNSNKDFTQNIDLKSYVEKGIDKGLYSLSGTTLTLTLSTVFSWFEKAPYKLLEWFVDTFKQKEQIAPDTFTLYCPYYGTLHGCVISNVSISTSPNSPVSIDFTIEARYLDERTKKEIQEGIDSMDKSKFTRIYTFFDLEIALSGTPTEAFNWPNDIGDYITSFDIDMTLETQKNWVLGEDDSIDDELNPQKITAAKDITFGEREIKGTMSYIMPHDKLYGFYKVLEHTSEISMGVDYNSDRNLYWDSIMSEVEGFQFFVLTFDIPIFMIPERPLDTSVVTQTVTFYPARSIDNEDFYSALKVTIKTD